MTCKTHLFLILLLALVTLDVALTSYGLENNIITEGNPLLQNIVANPLLHLGIKLIFVAIVFCAALSARKLYRQEWSDRAIYIPNIALYSVVILNNTYWLLLA